MNIRQISMILSLAATATAAGMLPSVTPLPTTRRDIAVPATTDAGEGAVNARVEDVEYRYASGRTGRTGFLVLFDSGTGRFTWDLRMPTDALQMLDTFKRCTLLYSLPDRLVSFTFDHAIVVRESSEKASSVNDAESRSLQAAAQWLASLESDPREIVPPRVIRVHKDPRAVAQIDLRTIANDFTLAPGSEAYGGPVTLRSVSRQGETWILIVEARWKVRITLDREYGFKCPACGFTKVD